MASDQEVLSVRFCVPSLGTELVLAQPWKFALWNEQRNKTLIQAFGKKFEGRWDRRGFSHGEVTIPQGTRLLVDRIYIRRGAEAFDSITFRIKKGGCPSKKALEGTRFWAKLKDVNKIVCYPVGSNPEVRELFASFGEPGMRLLDLD